MNEQPSTVYEIQDEIDRFIAVDRPLSRGENINYLKVSGMLTLRKNRTKLLIGAGGALVALGAVIAPTLPRSQQTLVDQTVESIPTRIPQVVASVGCPPEKYPAVNVNGRVFRSQLVYGGGEAVFMRNIILRNYVPGLVLQVIPDMLVEYIGKSGIKSDVNKVSLISFTSVEFGSHALNNDTVLLGSKNQEYMQRYIEIFNIPPNIEFYPYTVLVTEIIRDIPVIDRSNTRLGYVLNDLLIGTAVRGINILNKRPLDYGAPSGEVIRAGGVDMQFINVVSADMTLPENPQIARLGNPLLYSLPKC